MFARTGSSAATCRSSSIDPQAHSFLTPSSPSRSLDNLLREIEIWSRIHSPRYGFSGDCENGTTVDISRDSVGGRRLHEKLAGLHFGVLHTQTCTFDHLSLGRAMRDNPGNTPPLPGRFPDYPPRSFATAGRRVRVNVDSRTLNRLRGSNVRQCRVVTETRTHKLASIALSVPLFAGPPRVDVATCNIWPTALHLRQICPMFPACPRSPSASR